MHTHYLRIIETSGGEIKKEKILPCVRTTLNRFRNQLQNSGYRQVWTAYVKLKILQARDTTIILALYDGEGKQLFGTRANEDMERYGVKNIADQIDVPTLPISEINVAFTAAGTTVSYAAEYADPPF